MILIRNWITICRIGKPGGDPHQNMFQVLHPDKEVPPTGPPVYYWTYEGHTEKQPSIPQLISTTMTPSDHIKSRKHAEY